MNEDTQSELAYLRSLCARAALEIEDHWDDHCDPRGFGPQSLLRALEDAGKGDAPSDATFSSHYRRRCEPLVTVTPEALAGSRDRVLETAPAPVDDFQLPDGPQG